MSTYLYVGTRPARGAAENESSMFHILKWDAESGSLIPMGKVPGIISAGNVQTDPERRLLYVTDEVSENPYLGMGGGGRVFLFSADPETGMLTKLQDELSFGGHPSYIALDPEKHYMITTHFCPMPPVPVVAKREDGSYEMRPTYGDTTTVLRRILPDGSLGDPCDVIYHAPENRRPAHMHCVVPDPTGEMYAACDIGLDRVYMYRIDSANGKLEILGGKPTEHTSGAGSRYCAFHPTKPWLFVNSEHKPVMTAFRYTKAGELTEICTVSSFPEGTDERGLMASDIAMDKGGKYIYNCMRGTDTVSVFEIDGETGTLRLVQVYQMEGKKPRSCEISPDGKYLIVANTESDLVEVIAIDSDGRLSKTDKSVKASAPGTLTFMSF